MQELTLEIAFSINFPFSSFIASSYFEFAIQIDDLTNDVSLIITDFAEDEQEKEENALLWNTQIENLKHALGS